MANETIDLTTEEMIDFYAYIDCLASVALFETLHYISETAEAEEALKRFEALEMSHREELRRLQNNISKKVVETVVKIWEASMLRSYNEQNESEESEE